jgi:outer membrane receptor protein involved in Fe transport
MLSLSGEAVGQQSASAAAMLEEVVVTARRREENLQELPLSIQAITADAMQAQGIYNIQQVTEFVPNVVLAEDVRKNDTRFFVRGVGGGFSNPAQVFGVGMYVDGHYMSGSLGAFMSTVDVERVEVLRGPQGTLFGKNTTGGAISLIAAKPGPDFDSYVTLRAAEFDQTDIRAMVNTPITDNLFFRGNIASEQNDGYYYNRFNGEYTGGTDQQSVGLALRWLVSDSWTLDARLNAAYDRDENQGGQCQPRPDADLYADLTVNGAVGFAGPDLISGTADDIVYEGPGPFTDDFASGGWGGSNDNPAYSTDPVTGLNGNGIGGSDLRIDALYPGANAAWLNSCWEDQQSGNVWQTYQDADTYSDIDNEMFMLDATWTPDGPVGAFENVSLQIKGAWRYNSYNYYQDRDYGPGIIDHIGNNPTGSRGIARYTDEFEIIFSGELSDRATLTTGLYLFDDIARSGNGTCLGKWWAAFDPNGQNNLPVDPGDDGVVGTGDDFVQVGTINGMDDDTIICDAEGGTLFVRLPDSLGDRRASTGHGQTEGESTAIYAHLDYALNDSWNLAVGARWMEDVRRQQNVEIGIVPGTCTFNNPGDPSPLGFCDPVYALNRESVLQRGLLGRSEASFDEITPTISLTRHLTPGDTIQSGIVYGTISQGYLTGAFNDELNPYSPAFSRDKQSLVQSLIPYDPEFVTNYELGFKGTLLDGNLRISADVFFMDYTDKQEAIEVDNPDGTLGPDPALEYTANAGEVAIKGIELELRASPWDGGFVSLDLGMLDASYDNFTYTDIISGEVTTVAETQISNRTPEWTATASVEHAFQLANGGTLTPQLGIYMQDDYEFWGGLAPGEQSPMCHQDSYTKLRARLAYEPADANWQAALFGYNLTDEEILITCGEIRSGTIRTVHEAPTQWGAEFTMRFGAGN